MTTCSSPLQMGLRWGHGQEEANGATTSLALSTATLPALSRSLDRDGELQSHPKSSSSSPQPKPPWSAGSTPAEEGKLCSGSSGLI